MSPTVTLSDENATGLAWAVELTGFSLEEVVNLLLTDVLKEFQPDLPYCELVENTFGCWQFKTLADAERTLSWVRKKIRKGRKGRFPLLDTAVREVEPGRFEIDAFKTYHNGEWERVC